MSRRRFLERCAAYASAAGLMGAPAWLRSAPKTGKTRVRIVYALHSPVQEGPDWPNKGFDFRPAMERTNGELAKRFPAYEFLPTLATGPEQAQKIVEDDRKSPVDGYLAYQMNCWNRVVQTLAGTGKPVLYADFQYGGSGGFLVYTAGFLRAGAKNVGFVASSNIDDLVEAVKCFGGAKAAGPTYDFAAAGPGCG